MNETTPILKQDTDTNKITPFLMFESRLGEALDFYISIFKNSRILNSAPDGQGGVMSATFELEGQRLLAFNGGPHFKFSEAISLFVDCKSQAEVDELWGKLIADGGEESQCGWLKDKFGVSWQIIPSALMELMSDPNPAKSQAVMQAMFKMRKIIVADLQAAHAAA